MSQLHHPMMYFDPAPAEALSSSQREVLRRAVAKIILIGEHVGVSVDQMILLLDSGLTVRELLDYLTFKKSEMA
jgi:hypothetical protein